MSALAPKKPEGVISFVWETVAGFKLEPVPGDGPRNAGGGGLLSTVAIGGIQEGVIALHCQVALARRAAASMFGIPAASIDMAQALDALGELTNILAGNLKTLLPVSCRLGLPATIVLESPAPAAAEPGKEGLRLHFRAGSDLLVVSFHPAALWQEAFA